MIAEWRAHVPDRDRKLAISVNLGHLKRTGVRFRGWQESMNPTPTFRRLSALLPGLVLVLALLVSIYDAGGAGTYLRNLVFDGYQQILPRTPSAGGPHAVYVDIDAETSSRFGAWPWPQKRLANLLVALKKQGARTILLDMPISEPDPTSASELRSLWGYLPEGLAGRLPQGVTQLKNAAKNAKLVASFTPGLPSLHPPRKPRLAAPLDMTGGDPRHFVPRFDEWRPSLPQIEAIADGMGATIPAQETGRTVHSIPALTEIEGTLYPSNALEALRVSHGGTGYRSIVSEPANGLSFDLEPGVSHVEIAGTDLDVATLKDGSLRLYFAKAGSQLSVPAWKVLTGASDIPSFDNRIAVVGVSVNGKRMLYGTPIGIPMASGEIMANAIDQIADGAFLTRPGWAATAEQAFIFLAGVLVIVAVTQLRFRWSLAFTLILIGGAAYGSWYAFDMHRWLIDPALASVTLLTVWLTGGLMTRLHTEDQIRFLETQFGNRLSEAGLAKVKAHPKLIQSEGQLRDVTSVVVGLRGFNVISDRYLEDPEAYADILNRFFSPMTKIVLERNGMVDRNVGDTLYAIWNAPLDAPNHASKGCDAALRMVENLEALNEFLEEDARRQHLSHVPLSLSIGIDTGPAITGNLGAIQRFDYGVMGEPVGFAAYLQKNARHFGPAIIVGEGSQKAVGDRYALLEIDLVSTPRHPEGRRVFALLGDPIMRANPKFRALQEAHALIFAAYRNQRWNEAKAAIAECRKLNGAIPTLYDFYESRIAYYQENPPGDNWNGAWFAGRI